MAMLHRDGGLERGMGRREGAIARRRWEAALVLEDVSVSLGGVLITNEWLALAIFLAIR